MWNKGQTRLRGWGTVIAVVSLCLLSSLTVPSVARAQAPGAICTLQLISEGEVLGVLADTPQNFNVAVLLPVDKSVNVPIPCDSLGSLALGVANQKNKNINFVAQVFSNDGVLFCSKGPFLLAVNGGRGITFADCQ